jgi:carbamoyl-phosphate synthase large subunit
MAVGSPLGQSIYKALMTSGFPVSIVLADINDMAAGFYLRDTDERLVLPLVREESYFEALSAAVERLAINVIFPVLSVEHTELAKHSAYFADRRVRIVSPGRPEYSICSDKLESMLALRAAGIAAPDTIHGAPGDELEGFLVRNGFPIVLKPRFGASSNDVFVVRDAERLRGLLAAYPEGHFVVQEYLDAPDEYTVGVFRSQDGSVERALVLRRELKFGLSYRGHVVEAASVAEYSIAVCRALRLHHSANVQLRHVRGVPVAFEVNPRLSSTTSVRAHFGFNEPEMILRDLFGELQSYPYHPRTGRFMRYWSEVYLESE